MELKVRPSIPGTCTTGKGYTIATTQIGHWECRGAGGGTTVGLQEGTPCTGGNNRCRCPSVFQHKLINCLEVQKVEAVFYRTLLIFRKNIAFWKVHKLRPLVLVSSTCRWRWVRSTSSNITRRYTTFIIANTKQLHVSARQSSHQQVVNIRKCKKENDIRAVAMYTVIPIP